MELEQDIRISEQATRFIGKYRKLTADVFDIAKRVYYSEISAAESRSAAHDAIFASRKHRALPEIRYKIKECNDNGGARVLRNVKREAAFLGRLGLVVPEIDVIISKKRGVNFQGDRIMLSNGYRENGGGFCHEVGHLIEAFHTPLREHVITRLLMDYELSGKVLVPLSDKSFQLPRKYSRVVYLEGNEIYGTEFISTCLEMLYISPIEFILARQATSTFFFEMLDYFFESGVSFDLGMKTEENTTKNRQRNKNEINRENK